MHALHEELERRAGRWPGGGGGGGGGGEGAEQQRKEQRHQREKLAQTVEELSAQPDGLSLSAMLCIAYSIIKYNTLSLSLSLSLPLPLPLSPSLSLPLSSSLPASLSLPLSLSLPPSLSLSLFLSLRSLNVSFLPLLYLSEAARFLSLSLSRSLSRSLQISPSFLYILLIIEHVRFAKLAQAAEELSARLGAFSASVPPFLALSHPPSLLPPLPPALPPPFSPSLPFSHPGLPFSRPVGGRAAVGPAGRPAPPPRSVFSLLRRTPFFSPGRREAAVGPAGRTRPARSSVGDFSLFAGPAGPGPALRASAGRSRPAPPGRCAITRPMVGPAHSPPFAQ